MKITEQNWKEELLKYHIETAWGNVINYDMPEYEKHCDFIQSLITSIKQEERERMKNRYTLSEYDAHFFAGMILRELGFPEMPYLDRSNRNTIDMLFDLIKQNNFEFVDQRSREYVKKLQSLTEEDVINSK